MLPGRPFQVLVSLQFFLGCVVDLLKSCNGQKWGRGHMSMGENKVAINAQIGLLHIYGNILTPDRIMLVEVFSAAGFRGNSFWVGVDTAKTLLRHNIEQRLLNPQCNWAALRGIK
ncbi:MAG: hypothetical protein WAT19_14450 [Ferruginibacter sp.]